MSKALNPENEHSNGVDLGMLLGMLGVMAALSVIVYFLAVQTNDLRLETDCQQHNQAQACLDLAERVSQSEAAPLRQRAANIEGGAQ